VIVRYNNSDDERISMSPMKSATLALLLSASLARADFSADRYSEQPEAVARIALAAQAFGDPLSSHTDGVTSYYLSSIEYIGPIETDSGTVHVARLFFIRSAPRSSKLPPRGHTFIVFLDRQFRLRDYWRVERTLGRLGVRGSSLFLNDGLLFNYVGLPKSGEVLVDGEVYRIPHWK